MVGCLMRDPFIESLLYLSVLFLFFEPIFFGMKS